MQKRELIDFTHAHCGSIDLRELRLTSILEFPELGERLFEELSKKLWGVREDEQVSE